MSYNITEENSSNNSDIDIKEIVSVLWDSKNFILLVTSLFLTLSLLYVLTLTNHYKSEALVISAEGQSGISNSLSGLGGLASMAGFNLPSSNGDKSEIAIKTIESRAFLNHLITFDYILPSIMAAKSYDTQSRKIKFDPKIYNETNGEWVRGSKENQPSKPSYLEAYDTYIDQISISRDEQTNLITISVEHLSPVFAKEFLELIISEANELLRNKDLRESSDAIEFLNTEIPKSSLITMKEAINKVLQSQLETQMLSRVNSEYVLKIIEPPFIPEKKSKPMRVLICILFTLLGGIISVSFIFIRKYIFLTEDKIKIF